MRGRKKVRMVEGVEELPSELQAGPLCEVEVLQHGKVEVHATIGTENPPARITERERRGRLECFVFKSAFPAG